MRGSDHGVAGAVPAGFGLRLAWLIHPMRWSPLGFGLILIGLALWSAARADAIPPLAEGIALLNEAYYAPTLPPALAAHLRENGRAVPTRREVPEGKDWERLIDAARAIPGDAADGACLVLSHTIDRRGRPQDIVVEYAHPQGRYDALAIDVLAQWRFDKDDAQTGQRYQQRIAFGVGGRFPEGKRHLPCDDIGVYYIQDPLHQDEYTLDLNRSHMPKYPMDALRRGIEGCAMVAAYFAGPGKPEAVSLLMSTPIPEFGTPTVATISQWEAKAPVTPGWYAQVFEYRMEDGAGRVGCPPAPSFQQLNPGANP